MPNNSTDVIDVTDIYFKTGTNLFSVKRKLYLLKLVRYTHLNPIGAGMVKDLRTLNSYSRTFCGQQACKPQASGNGTRGIWKFFTNVPVHHGNFDFRIHQIEAPDTHAG